MSTVPASLCLLSPTFIDTSDMAGGALYTATLTLQCLVIFVQLLGLLHCRQLARSNKVDGTSGADRRLFATRSLLCVCLSSISLGTYWSGVEWRLIPAHILLALYSLIRVIHQFCYMRSSADISQVIFGLDLATTLHVEKVSFYSSLIRLSIPDFSTTVVQPLRL